MTETATIKRPDVAAPTSRAGGRLSLTFAPDGQGKTYLARQFASYPFHVCRVQYLDPAASGFATLYTQSCSGGLFDGDRLTIEIEAAPGAEAHVTTQASTIVHRTRHAPAEQSADLTVRDGGFLEYLPDPNILFPQSRYRSKQRLQVDKGGRAMLCESFLGHDPEGGGGIFDSFMSETLVVDEEGAPLALDRMTAEGASVATARRGLTGPHLGQGTFFLLDRKAAPSDDGDGTVSALRLAVASLPGVYAGVSDLPHGLGFCVRILADDGDALRRALLASWREARRALTGHPPGARKK